MMNGYTRSMLFVYRTHTYTLDEHLKKYYINNQIRFSFFPFNLWIFAFA